MLAFVTGGTGFIGSNLVAALCARGIGVRLLRRAGSPLRAVEGLPCEHRVGDVLGSAGALARAMSGCAWVFHTAGIADYWRHRGSDMIYRTNVTGTRNVLAAARQAGVERLVFTSSIAALGVPPPGRRLDESSEFNLPPRRFPYGHSKHLAELQVQRAVAAGLPAVVVNPSVVVGARDIGEGSGSLVIAAARGRLRVAPPGGLNFVAVRDVVHGHIAAAERGRVGERYVLAGEDLTYRAAFAALGEVVGRPVAPLVLPARVMPVVAAAVTAARAVAGPRLPVDGNQLRLSSADVFAEGGKARTELGVPCTPFRTAVQDAHDWYQEHHVIRR